MNDRLFPARPILAVSVAVFHHGRVLVVRRAREPMIGHYTLPGGVVEIGEPLAVAAARELREEVGVKAEIIAFNRHVEAIEREGERVECITSSPLSSRGGRAAKRAKATKSTPSIGSIRTLPALADNAGTERNLNSAARIARLQP